MLIIYFTVRLELDLLLGLGALVWMHRAARDQRRYAIMNLYPMSVISAMMRARVICHQSLMWIEFALPCGFQEGLHT